MSEPKSYPISVTARHMALTDSIRDYATEKVRSIPLEYPQILEAKVVCDVQEHGDRQKAEIILVCTNHIIIEADTETHDLYEAIDLTLDKVKRQMRKEKTKWLNAHGRH